MSFQVTSRCDRYRRPVVDASCLHVVATFASLPNQSISFNKSNTEIIFSKEIPIEKFSTLIDLRAVNCNGHPKGGGATDVTHIWQEQLVVPIHSHLRAVR